MKALDESFKPLFRKRLYRRDNDVGIFRRAPLGLLDPDLRIGILNAYFFDGLFN